VNEFSLTIELLAVLCAALSGSPIRGTSLSRTVEPAVLGQLRGGGSALSSDDSEWTPKPSKSGKATVGVYIHEADYRPQDYKTSRKPPRQGNWWLTGSVGVALKPE